MDQKEESEQCKRYHDWMSSLKSIRNYSMSYTTTAFAGFLYMRISSKHEKECVPERKGNK